MRPPDHQGLAPGARKSRSTPYRSAENGRTAQDDPSGERHAMSAAYLGVGLAPQPWGLDSAALVWGVNFAAVQKSSALSPALGERPGARPDYEPLRVRPER